MNGRLLVLISIMFCFLFQGCSYNRTHYEKVRLMTAADYKAMQIINDLRGRGVSVSLAEGEEKDSLGTVKIFIKNVNIFNVDSANLNADAFNVLDKVIALLNCYEEEVVRIQGGPDSKFVGNIKYARALALARAHRVAQYLWSQDIDATFLYAMKGTVPKDSVAIVFQKYRK